MSVGELSDDPIIPWSEQELGLNEGASADGEGSLSQANSHSGDQEMMLSATSSDELWAQFPELALELID